VDPDSSMMRAPKSVLNALQTVMSVLIPLDAILAYLTSSKTLMALVLNPAILELIQTSSHLKLVNLVKKAANGVPATAYVILAKKISSCITLIVLTLVTKEASETQKAINARTVLRTVKNVLTVTLVSNAIKASIGRKKTKSVMTNVTLEKSTSTEFALLALIPTAPNVYIKEHAVNVKITL
jgi:hypothetical protein